MFSDEQREGGDKEGRNVFVNYSVSQGTLEN